MIEKNILGQPKNDLLDLIDKKYIETLQRKISFEEVSLWASEIIYKDEHGELEYDSGEDVSLLFSALTYLLGLGTEVSPGNYLYTLEDVEIEYKNFFINFFNSL